VLILITGILNATLAGRGPARDEMRRTIHNGLARAVAKAVEPTSFWDALELDDVSRVPPEDKCAIAIVHPGTGARARECCTHAPPIRGDQWFCS